MKISVVIVKYHSEKYLNRCLESVKNEKPFEIIVVDNDKENLGYGRACNIGAEKASGNLILFLNPDTKLLPNCLKKMQEYFYKNKSVGVLGPKIYLSDKCDKIQYSCCRKSGLVSSLIVYGSLQRCWFNNPVWKHFTYQKELQTGKPVAVDVVSGAALMVKKTIFSQIGGFDKNIFLYFEENDLCLRIKKLGHKVVYLPQANIIHYGGGSTQDSDHNELTFRQSRKYYFNKHYNYITSRIINILLA